eukprot:GDKI01006834.1.p1 GENE.GDKI01006834.1~~GDKI01006834.1.p1  ORF type:complete len:123 (-),score=27.61 GDKI01006834.1:152-520(-)
MLKEYGDRQELSGCQVYTALVSAQTTEVIIAERPECDPSLPESVRLFDRIIEKPLTKTVLHDTMRTFLRNLERGDNLHVKKAAGIADTQHADGPGASGVADVRVDVCNARLSGHGTSAIVTV